MERCFAYIVLIFFLICMSGCVSSLSDEEETLQTPLDSNYESNDEMSPTEDSESINSSSHDIQTTPSKVPETSEGEYKPHAQEDPLTGIAGIAPESNPLELTDLEENETSEGEYRPHEQEDPLTGDADPEPEKPPLELTDSEENETSKDFLLKEHPFSDDVIRKTDGKFPGAEDEELQLKFTISDYPIVEHQVKSNIDINAFKSTISETLWEQRDTHILPKAVAYNNGYIDIRHTPEDYAFSLREISENILLYKQINLQSLSTALYESANEYRIQQLSGINVMYYSINEDTIINDEKYVLCFIFYLDTKGCLIESFVAYNKVSDTLIFISTSNIFYPIITN